MSRALVTGCAGFVASHLCERLVDLGWEVVGVDNFTPVYDRARKEDHLQRLRDEPAFRLVEADVAELPGVDALVGDVDVVWHLAAQAGVRGSFGEGFRHYVHANVLSTQRLLDAAAGADLQAFVYASSSSVYGNAAVRPTPEDTPLRPVSPYGMTKVATETLAGTYHDIAGVPTIGLRYFTVYGPRQRPDMAFSRFIATALRGEPIDVFGYGLQQRDFTYIDDAISATFAAAERGRPGRAYNVGGGTPVTLLEAIEVLGEQLDRRVDRRHQPAAEGDARDTAADGDRCAAELGVRPATPIAVGLAQQVEWTLERAAGDRRAA